MLHPTKAPSAHRVRAQSPVSWVPRFVPYFWASRVTRHSVLFWQAKLPVDGDDGKLLNSLSQSFPRGLRTVQVRAVPSHARTAYANRVQYVQ